MSITLERSTLASLAPVFREAARIITVNGHHQGDYLPDPFNRREPVFRPYAERPLSIVAALWCAETGSPRRVGPLSTAAIRFLAGRVKVDGEPAFWRDDLSQESHVASWGDVPSRTVAEVVNELQLAADGAEFAAVTS
jgi:hypothetical protein